MATLEDFVGTVGAETVQNVRATIKTIAQPIIDSAPRELPGINGDYLLNMSLRKIRDKHPTVAAKSGKDFYGFVVNTLIYVMRESGYATPAPGTLPPRMDLHLLEFYKEKPES